MSWTVSLVRQFSFGVPDVVTPPTGPATWTATTGFTDNGNGTWTATLTDNGDGTWTGNIS